MLGCGVSGACFLFVLACLGCCLGLVCSRFFCFLFPFASLHALALSLTGAQRTDSSSASKKKLDANNWTQLDPSDEAFNRFPNKKLIGSFWPLLAEVHADAATDIEAIVYHPSDGAPLDSERIFSTLLRRFLGLNDPQTWNPFRGVFRIFGDNFEYFTLVHLDYHF